MKKLPQELSKYVKAISESGNSIYVIIEPGHPTLWLPTNVLELILKERLVGLSLTGLALRTRSKVIKVHVCEALGYPIPKTFIKTKPRFPGQNFDTYVQKSNNLQIWNEEISPSRRYVLIRINDKDTVTKIKVVDGQTLSFLDTTGTLTQKYQARVEPTADQFELFTKDDTNNLIKILGANPLITKTSTPDENPSGDSLFSIKELFKKLRPIVGKVFADPGKDQERNRGGDLHKKISAELGYKTHRDNGQFPDIRHQLLEVKLQTSPTIDLGLVLPNSKEPLDCPRLNGVILRHCDVRYAIIYGHTDNKKVTITNLIMTTGERFFLRFKQFGGKVLNKKLQIPLPDSFFD